jgi:hypothetical protein
MPEEPDFPYRTAGFRRPILRRSADRRISMPSPLWEGAAAPGQRGFPRVADRPQPVRDDLKSSCNLAQHPGYGAERSRHRATFVPTAAPPPNPWSLAGSPSARDQPLPLGHRQMVGHSRPGLDTCPGSGEQKGNIILSCLSQGTCLLNRRPLFRISATASARSKRAGRRSGASCLSVSRRSTAACPVAGWRWVPCTRWPRAAIWG